jgi:hypothetical protein
MGARRRKWEWLGKGGENEFAGGANGLCAGALNKY